MKPKSSTWFYAVGALVIVLILAALYFHHRSDGIGSTAYEDISPNLVAQSLRDAERQGRERAYENRQREQRERDSGRDRDNYSHGSPPRGSSPERSHFAGHVDDCSSGCQRNSKGQLVTERNGQWYEVQRSGQRSGGNNTGTGGGFVGGSCTFADFGVWSFTDYLAGCGCYEHKVNDGDGGKDVTERCRCDECEVCNYCGDCAKGAAPPVRADFGNACTSSANLCGQTNAGTIECDGCTATTPALPSDYYSFHTSPPNVCGDTNEVQIQCGNRATTPPNTQCTATVDDLSVDPTIVRKDDTTELTWSCTYADYAVLYNITNGDRFILTDGTTLTAPNGETYTALGGTVTSGPIIAESDYILECHGEFSNSTTTASTTIRILPRFDEN